LAGSKREGARVGLDCLVIQRGLIWPTQCGVSRSEATECYICNFAYNIFVLIEFDIVAALQNQQLLRKTRTLCSLRRGQRLLRMPCRRTACGPIPCRCRHQSERAALPAQDCCSPPQRQQCQLPILGRTRLSSVPLWAMLTRFCTVLSGNPPAAGKICRLLLATPPSLFARLVERHVDCGANCGAVSETGKCWF